MIIVFVFIILVGLWASLFILEKQIFGKELSQKELEDVYMYHMHKQGQLSSLFWSEEKGLSVLLNKKDDGTISINVHHSSPSVVQNLFDLVDYFIDRMKQEKIPINDDLYDLNLDLAKGNLELSINGTFGNAIMQGLLKFLNQSAIYCNFTLVDDIVNKLQDDKLHEVNLSANPCGLNNVPDILEFITLSGLEYNRTKLKDFDNITLIKNQELIAAFDLDNYFNCHSELSFILNTQYNKISITKGPDNAVSISPQKDWIGTEKVNIIAKCGSEQLEDSFYVNVFESLLNNHAPDFLGEKCGNISLESGKNFTFDLNTCFRDYDRNMMEFSYSSKPSNIDIKKDKSIITLVPGTGNPKGYFYVYANDSIYQIKGKIEFVIIKEGLINNSVMGIEDNVTGSSSSEEEKDEENDGYLVINPLPNVGVVYLSPGETKFFSIKNNDFENIKWILDKKTVEESSGEYIFPGSDKGEYELIVEIQKDKLKDLKTWRIVVGESKTSIEKTQKTSSFGKIIVYMILGIILILVALVIGLKFIKKEKKGK